MQEVVQNQKDRISRLQEINNETNHENKKNQVEVEVQVPIPQQVQVQVEVQV